jgi:hypothetical protein
MTVNETPETLAKIEHIMERSIATAGRAMREAFGASEWRMSVQEFIDFWGYERMASIATVSARSEVHAAALDMRLVDGVFHVPTYANALRLRDHRANPRCVITSWQDSYHVAVVYGRATLHDTVGMVDVQVVPTRIYAIRPPAWHHANRPAVP